MSPLSRRSAAFAYRMHFSRRKDRNSENHDLHVTAFQLWSSVVTVLRRRLESGSKVSLVAEPGRPGSSCPRRLHAATPSATALDRAACWGWLCGGKPGLLDKGDPGVCREGRWPLRQLDLLPGFVVEEPYREVPGLHTGLPVQHPEHCAWRTISTTWPTALALQFLEILHYWLIAKCSSTWTWSWSDVESSSWWWKPAVARVPQGDTARLGPRRLFVPAEALHGEATVVV